MKKTFETEGDEFYCDGDKCRKRTIHGLGAVAKIQWASVGDHPYTGLFKGGNAGFVRFSTGGPPGALMIPGVGIKFLRDDTDSGNFVAMKDIVGQTSKDFFLNDFETHLPPPKGFVQIVGAIKFTSASNKIQTIGLSDFASYTQEGAREYPVVFPFKLRLHPVYELPRDTLHLDYLD